VITTLTTSRLCSLRLLIFHLFARILYECFKFSKFLGSCTGRLGGWISLSQKLEAAMTVDPEKYLLHGAFWTGYRGRPSFGSFSRDGETGSSTFRDSPKVRPSCYPMIMQPSGEAYLLNTVAKKFPRLFLSIVSKI
jgi:hypothetical protein